MLSTIRRRPFDRANETYGHPKVSRWVSEMETFIAPVQYDLVVSFNVLEHLHNRDEYFEVALRLCEKHGHVAIITPNRNRLSNLIRRARRQPQLLCD
jgi:2-polyprenyl-3-methyl-5-hydroxy-6-metoxy-1,4-benzoquinol methylase